MANLFAVTTVADKLKAENGNATTVFTVTNTTSRPLRGVARIKTMGSTEAAWIKIEGEAEHDFPAGGTHQYSVNFSKTPTASQPAETFPFRFDAISTNNPDEDFTEGPIVTVEFPEKKEPIVKPFPWWIAAVAAVLLLLIGGVVLWRVLRNTDVEVPNVTNKTFIEAEKELKEKEFTPERVEEIAPDKPLDTVFRQEPSGDSKVSADKKTVKLIVSAKTTVPNLKGSTLSAALNKLKSNELKNGTITGDGDAIKDGTLNQVSSQNPVENTVVAKGSEVNFGFPCINNPPFRRCFKIKDLGSSVLEINPKIRREILRVNP